MEKKVYKRYKEEKEQIPKQERKEILKKCGDSQCVEYKREYAKKYYQLNKTKNAKEKMMCECGYEHTVSNKDRHLNSIFHIVNIAKKNKLNNIKNI